MLSVTNKPFMLSVKKLNVVMLSVFMLDVMAPKTLPVYLTVALVAPEIMNKLLY